MEITANLLQSVNTNQNVLFTDSAVNTCCGSMTWRNGSGLVNLRGLTNQCRALYRVTFGANIAIPDGGDAAQPISVAIAIDGEPIASTAMISTPNALAQFNNVAGVVFIAVPRGCCSTVSVENTSSQTISVQNANLVVERVA